MIKWKEYYTLGKIKLGGNVLRMLIRNQWHYWADYYYILSLGRLPRKARTHYHFAILGFSLEFIVRKVEV